MLFFSESHIKAGLSGLGLQTCALSVAGILCFKTARGCTVVFMSVWLVVHYVVCMYVRQWVHCCLYVGATEGVLCCLYVGAAKATLRTEPFTKLHRRT